MASLREKLVERTQPFLEPGESARHVFLAQGGPTPYLSFLTWLVFFWMRYRIVVVTDRAIVIVPAKKWLPAKPTGEPPLARLPRQTVMGPVSGLWATTNFAGEKLYVHKRFHKDISAADAELGSQRV